MAELTLVQATLREVAATLPAAPNLPNKPQNTTRRPDDGPRVYRPTQDEIDRCEREKRATGSAPNPYCQLCQGFGKVHPVKPDGRPNYSALINCPEPGCLDDSWRAYRGTPSHLLSCGVSYRMLSFDSFKRRPGTEDALNNFQKLARGTADFRQMLCCGDTGCGKTHLCEALTIALNERMITARLFNASDLFSQMRESIRENGVEEIIQRLKTVQALILDDFVCTDWILGRMEEVIDARRRAEGLITVITSNQTPDWWQHASPRIYSRFSEPGFGVIVVNGASDYRR